MSQIDTKSRPTCMTLSSLGVSIESNTSTTTAHLSEEGMTFVRKAVKTRAAYSSYPARSVLSYVCRCHNM